MATCIPTGKRYIGQTADSNGFERRQYHHLWTAKHPEHPQHYVFHRAIAKHGADNFKWEILLRCNVEQLDEYETRAIETWDTVAPKGLNMVGGPTSVAGQRGAYKRKREPKEELPANVWEMWVKGEHVGYCTAHNGKTRGVASPHVSLATKKEMCLQWLDDMKAGRTPVLGKIRNERNADLPPSIYRLSDGRLLVHVGKHPQRTFRTIELAVAHKAALQELGDKEI